MDRRKFMQGSLAGIAGAASLESGLGKARNHGGRVVGPAVKPASDGIPAGGAQESKIYPRKGHALFPGEVPKKLWTRFEADGFSDPVCGVVYELDKIDMLSALRYHLPNGMPLGGIDTGCIDLDKNGIFGLTTIFNSHVPRRGPLALPFLGVSVDDMTWILANVDNRHTPIISWGIPYLAPSKEENGHKAEWTPEDYFRARNLKVRGAKQIRYWGHYPVADLEYELSEIPAPGGAAGPGHERGDTLPAPLTVGLRAWSPFVPGDIEASTIPGAAFEVQLRNRSAAAQKGALAFSFPGPSRDESEGCTKYPRRKVEGKSSGISVTNGGDIGYAICVAGESKGVRTGGELGSSGEAWLNIGTALPPASEGEPGASVALDFSLEPGEQKTVRFILSWYSPRWKGGGTLAAGGRTYTHMYAGRHKNAVQVAELLAGQHQSLLKRVLAWQQVIYAEADLPVWLRESLVNILHLITEDGMWAMAKPPLGDWCKPEDGLFAMNESPRDSSQMETTPCSFYGNMPLVYFFPKLALSTLRGYKAYQNPDGSASFHFSQGPYVDLAPDFSYVYQPSSNGVCYVDMVDRYWQFTGDDEMLREFYPSVKSNMIFTMGLNTGPDGVISVPTGNVNRGYGFVGAMAPGKGLVFGGEHNGVFGMSSHLGGMHLAQLRIVRRMAEKMGDAEFARQCADWVARGTGSMEDKMWAGTYYLNYWDQELGKKSDLIYAYVLTGEWMARYHGLPGVFQPDRVKSTLETISKINMSLTKFGAVMFAEPRGDTVGMQEVYNDALDAAYGARSLFASETILLGCTYVHAGQRDLGLELVRRLWEDVICKQEITWEQPNLLRGDTGEATFGRDYYQNMLLWALATAAMGQDLAGAAKPEGLINRLIQVGKSA